MKVLAFNFHGALTRSFQKALQALGHELWIPSGKPGAWKGLTLGHPALAQDDLEGVNHLQASQIEEVAFDVVLMTVQDVQRDVLRAIWPIQERLGAKLVFFCGNELPHYRWDLARNVLAADRASFEYARSRGKHALLYYPWIPYGDFPCAGPSDVPVLRSYIGNYAARYPADFRAAERIVAQVPGLALEHADGQDAAGVGRLMRDSMATLHLKPKEGYGYAVIESLASGRPVVMPRKYVRGKTLEAWVVEGESALLFDHEAEAVEKLRHLASDAAYRHRLQARAAELVRDRLDNAAQTAALGAFLEALRPQGPKSWLTHGLDLWKRHRPGLG